MAKKPKGTKFVRVTLDLLAELQEPVTSTPLAPHGRCGRVSIDISCLLLDGISAMHTKLRKKLGVIRVAPLSVDERLDYRVGQRFG